jgi:hypothetical protein
MIKEGEAMLKDLSDVIEVIENLPAEEAFTVTETDLALELASKVLQVVKKYVDKHGNIALRCGGEFVWQSDDGQFDAISSFTEILEAAAEYVDCENPEDDE